MPSIGPKLTVSDVLRKGRAPALPSGAIGVGGNSTTGFYLTKGGSSWIPKGFCSVASLYDSFNNPGAEYLAAYTQFMATTGSGGTSPTTSAMKSSLYWPTTNCVRLQVLQSHLRIGGQDSQTLANVQQYIKYIQNLVTVINNAGFVAILCMFNAKVSVDIYNAHIFIPTATQTPDVSIVTSGTSYVGGDSFVQVSTTGNGSGFIGAVVVSGGGVTSLVSSSPGIGYRAGDQITLNNTHGGTQAVVRVNSIVGGEINRGTHVAWQNLAPIFATNGNVIYELFNEPGRNTDPTLNGAPDALDSDTDWKNTMQALVNEIREVANNLIIVPARQPSETYLPSNPGVTDPSGNGIAYGVHSYFAWSGGSTDWDSRYGNVAQNHAPIVFTEWKVGACNATAPGNMTSILNYNGGKKIGATQWVFDNVSDMVGPAITSRTASDDTIPWTWVPDACSGVASWTATGTITAISYDSTTGILTVSTSGTNPSLYLTNNPEGDAPDVYISGVTPSDLNGTWSVVSTSSTGFTATFEVTATPPSTSEIGTGANMKWNTVIYNTSQRFANWMNAY